MVKKYVLPTPKENIMRSATFAVGGPLAQGKLEGYEVQCPWHGSRFDIRTGKVARSPAMRSEPTYEIKVQDDNILIKNRAKYNQS